MGHLAKQQDASFFRVFFNPYHYGVLTLILVFFTGSLNLLTKFDDNALHLLKLDG